MNCQAAPKRSVMGVPDLDQQLGAFRFQQFGQDRKLPAGKVERHMNR
jgi:hypothetical protein